MATLAESYELVFQGKRNRKLAKQYVATSISPPATEPDAADAQPPEASLLSLPNELLNYVCELTVVKDPDEGPTEAHVGFKRMITRRHLFRCPTPSPALGRTCRVLEETVLPIYYGRNTFAFRSPSPASRWLSQKRRMRSTTPFRQIATLFDAKGMKSVISHKRDGKCQKSALRAREDWQAVIGRRVFLLRSDLSAVPAHPFEED